MGKLKTLKLKIYYVFKVLSGSEILLY